MNSKNNALRKTVGISQEELAQILNVSRSQLSLYELGKRNLPVEAIERMVSLIYAMQSTELLRDALSKEETLQKFNQEKVLNQLVLKNKHQQLITTKKIYSFENKQNQLFSIKKAIQILNNEKHNKSILKTIDIKIKNKLLSITDENLLKLKIQKDVLQYEEKIIKKYLKNI